MSACLRVMIVFWVGRNTNTASVFILEDFFLLFGKVCCCLVHSLLAAEPKYLDYVLSFSLSLSLSLSLSRSSLSTQHTGNGFVWAEIV